MLVAFLFKDELFAIVLAPKNADFIIYRFFCRIADLGCVPSLCPEVFYVKMINTQLAAQFITHMSVSFYTGFLLASPYVIYQLFRFVSPALYENEKKYSTRIVGWGYFLFYDGSSFELFFDFPSYFPAFLLPIRSVWKWRTRLSFAYGYIDDDEPDDGDCFRDSCPLLAFCQTGISTADFMKRYRRHAIVIILIVGAVITPTSDVFTLMMVSVPMYLLYEVSIWIVSRIGKKQREESVEEVLEKS